VHRHRGTTDRHARSDPADIKRTCSQPADDPAPGRVAESIQGQIYVSLH
jgi:hypothetical protein